MKRIHLTSVACVALFLLLVGCTPAREEEQPRLTGPAAAVQGLLDLRVQGSADTSAYAEFLASEALAATAAEEDSMREGEGSPIPGWETPEVTKEGTSTAEVTVVWKRSADDTAWPETTVFVLERTGGRWKIVDAAE